MFKSTPLPLKTIVILILLGAIVFLLVGCSPPGNAPGDKDLTEGNCQEIGIEERKRMDLYIAVMEAAFEQENGGNDFIAVKLNTLEGLNDGAKDEVLRELTGLSPNVYDFEDVKNDDTKFESDADGNHIKALNGTVLWVKVKEYSSVNSTIAGASWFGNLAAVFPEYKAVFKNAKWKLELTSMAVS